MPDTHPTPWTLTPKQYEQWRKKTPQPTVWVVWEHIPNSDHTTTTRIAGIYNNEPAAHNAANQPLPHGYTRHPTPFHLKSQ